MATISYTPKGVCSRKIDIEVEDGIVKKIWHFTGGCNGNTQGVSKLVEGMKVQDVINRLEGIDCNGRGTSCPAQLAQGFEVCTLSFRTEHYTDIITGEHCSPLQKETDCILFAVRFFVHILIFFRCALSETH